MSKSIGDKKIKAIIDLWENEMSIKEISEVMDVSTSTIYRVLIRFGAKEKSTEAVNRLTPEQKVQVIKMYQEGKPIQEILDEVGCSKPTAYNYINQAGLSRSLPVDKLQEVIKRYISNHSISVNDLVKEAGISKATFYRRLKEYRNEGEN
ncbi:helix-turn-helix domain-containing protein [Bacillus sp. NPDC077027]|uniref:helix-turn-helix domain-containing protein n=1 Tax=Bacillus sp. NPDC077027 TaxID=3390548 RepID=UPI003D02D8D5